MSTRTPGFADNRNNDTSRLSSQVKRVFDAINKQPFSEFQIIEDVDVNNVFSRVYHSLGRKPKGYIKIASSGAAPIANGEMNDRYIELRTNGGFITVSLFVF